MRAAKGTGKHTYTVVGHRNNTSMNTACGIRVRRIVFGVQHFSPFNQHFATRAACTAATRVRSKNRIQILMSCLRDLTITSDGQTFQVIRSNEVAGAPLPTPCVRLVHRTPKIKNASCQVHDLVLHVIRKIPLASLKRGTCRWWMNAYLDFHSQSLAPR